MSTVTVRRLQENAVTEEKRYLHISLSLSLALSLYVCVCGGGEGGYTGADV
jgi:hypothetical protein